MIRLLYPFLLTYASRRVNQNLSRRAAPGFARIHSITGRHPTPPPTKMASGVLPHARPSGYETPLPLRRPRSILALLPQDDSGASVGVRTIFTSFSLSPSLCRSRFSRYDCDPNNTNRVFNNVSFGEMDKRGTAVYHPRKWCVPPLKLCMFWGDGQKAILQPPLKSCVVWGIDKKGFYTSLFNCVCPLLYIMCVLVSWTKRDTE